MVRLANGLLVLSAIKDDQGAGPDLVTLERYEDGILYAYGVEQHEQS